MRSHWTVAVLFSTALTLGCGDRGANYSQNLEQNAGAPEETGPALAQPGSPAAAPSREDGSTVRDDRADTSGARSTTGSRTPGAATDRSRTADSVPAAETRRVPQFREVTVPAGPALPLDLLTALSSDTAQVETPVRAHLRHALIVDGSTALPGGAVLSGNVIDVDRAGRVQGRARRCGRK